jgi:YHS domain-containing protein
MPINTPPRTPICAACGCSLVRLHVGKEEAVVRHYNGREYFFCCQGCVDVFATDSKKLLQEYERRIDEIAVCPGCLGEIPLESIVELEYKGDVFGFCRCPHCKRSFERDPERLLNRLHPRVFGDREFKMRLLKIRIVGR